MKKLRFRFVAMLLLLALATSLSAECLGAEGASTAVTQYVSEIKTFASRAECEKAGYTWAPGNMNEGGTACYIGYKTTTDKAKAITDLKMLQMGIGYRTDFSYGKVLMEQNDIPAKAANLYTVACYFTDNYRDSPLARAALKLLNYYYVPAKYSGTGKDVPFGDFILSDDFTEDFIKEYLVRIGANGTNLLLAQLAAGVADIDPEDTWATRVSTSKTVAILSTTTSATSKTKKKTISASTLKKYDTSYLDIASKIASQLTDFAELAAEAKAYKDKNGSFDKTEVSQAAQKGEEASEAYADKAYEEGITNEDNYQLYYNLYEKLNAYQVTSDLKLGDYILSLKDLNTESKTDLRKFYPLVEAMTLEQAIMTRYAGLATMISYLENTEEYGKECEEQIEEKMGDLFDFVINEQLAGDSAYYNLTDAEKEARKKELKKSKRLSIYDGMDVGFFDDQVCVTNELTRANIASDNFAEFVGATNSEARARSRKEQIANLVLSCVMLADLTINLVITAFGLTATKFAAVFSYFTWPLLIGSLAAMFFIAFFSGKDKLEDWQKVETTEAEINWTSIPEAIYSIEHPGEIIDGEEVETTRVIYYTCVTNGVSGATEDLNKGAGTRWNALYYTTDENAGSPLIVGEDGTPFTVQSGTNLTPAGYKRLNIMGSSSQGNINAYAGDNQQELYFFYHTVDSEDNAAESSNQGTEVKTKTYLSGLMLAYSNNATIAKKKILDKGFILVDNNLTPDHYYKLDENQTKVYTYVGYKTTTDKNAAITDIRVMNSNTDESISFGGATYVNAGSTVGGDSLIYTMGKTAGTPITGNIYVYSVLGQVPEGYEPVNLLSGGPAFNFSRSSTTSYYAASFTISGYQNKFIYFQPSTMYTSANSTKYVSGLFALRCCCKSGEFPGDKLEQFKTYLGGIKDITLLTTLPSDSTCYYSDYTDSIAHIDGYDYYGALAYSTTYNPYRAIYDIKVYQGSNTAESLFPTIANANGTYAACESYGLGRIHYSTGWVQDWSEAWGYSEFDFQDKARIMILPYHSISKTVGPNLNTEELIEYTYTDLVRTRLCEVQPNTDYVTNCLKGLYVLGNTNTDINNAHPIKPEQLVASTNKSLANNGSYVPVVSFMTPNATTPMAINNMVSYNFKNGTYQKETRDGFTWETCKNCSFLNEAGPYYLYVKKDGTDSTKFLVGTKEKYISSLSVGGSYSTDAAMKLYNDDIARVGAIAGASDEIIYNNMALKDNQIWYMTGGIVKIDMLYRQNEDYKYQFEDLTCAYGSSKNLERASYIGVSRTNKASEAIYDIVRFMVDDTTEVRSTMKINNMTYMSAGGLIYDRNGAYALYYTNNPAAGIGVPITEITLENSPMINGKLGVTSMKMGSDGNTPEYTSKITASGKYILMSYEDRNTVGGAVAYTDLGIGAGATREQALEALLGKGFQTFINVDLNYRSSTGYAYMGYKSQSYESLVEDGDEGAAITDIVFTVGKEYTTTIEVDGITYEGDPTSLNAYTDGATVYMYVTRDPDVYTTLNGEQTERSNAITGMRFYVGDWIPDPTTETTWEATVDKNTGKSANLNEYVWSSTKGADTRLFLYVSRLDNSRKPNAKPSGYKYGTITYYTYWGHKA